jgi:hypothetical protein
MTDAALRALLYNPQSMCSGDSVGRVLCGFTLWSRIRFRPLPLEEERHVWNLQIDQRSKLEFLKGVTSFLVSRAAGFKKIERDLSAHSQEFGEDSMWE